MEHVILVSPDHVDRFFPGQAEMYLQLYKDVIDTATYLIDAAYSDIQYHSSKRIVNIQKTGTFERKIDSYYELIANAQTCIKQWEQQDERYHAFTDSLRIPENDICYHAMVKEEILDCTELLIDTVAAGDTIFYTEMIPSQSLHRRSGLTYTIRCIGGNCQRVPVIRDEQQAQIDNKITENWYSDKAWQYGLDYDIGLKQFYAEYKTVATESYIQIIQKSTDRAVLPEKFSIYPCR